MILLLWVRGVLARRLLRVAGAAAGIAVMVALLAAMALFLANASTSMTARAVMAVPIDWQVQMISSADPALVSKALVETPG